MENKLENIFNIKNINGDKEIFEILAKGNGDFKIERIISHGQTTPADEWYDQDAEEWVMVLQGDAKILFEDGTVLDLSTGNYILIKAHCKHRVIYTSNGPPCIWLAIHGKMSI
jgi:cupin 2 domain-containing protein